MSLNYSGLPSLAYPILTLLAILLGRVGRKAMRKIFSVK